jgi:hypothetical protein
MLAYFTAKYYIPYVNPQTFSLLQPFEWRRDTFISLVSMNKDTNKSHMDDDSNDNCPWVYLA